MSILPFQLPFARFSPSPGDGLHFLACFYLLLSLSCASAHAQVSAPALTDIAPAPSSRFPAAWYPPDSQVEFTSGPQRGAPYSGTLVTTWQTLAATGAESKSVSRSGFKARDGAGRTREETEMPQPDGRGGTMIAHEVSVGDPVTHCSFTWMEPLAGNAEPTAKVTCMSRTLQYTPNVYADVTVTKPRERQTSPGVTDLDEPLGTRRVEDLEVVGTRHTRTTMLNPNESPVQVVAELWYSPDLKELIELRVTKEPTDQDHQETLTSFKLTQIHRGEPDENLFYPPAQYKIKTGY
jgi:hypothetical protein